MTSSGVLSVKVSTRFQEQVPNYIVVDSLVKAMAKAVYMMEVGDKLEMCSDCFSTVQYKRASECGGPVTGLKNLKMCLQANRQF